MPSARLKRISPSLLLIIWTKQIRREICLIHPDLPAQSALMAICTPLTTLTHQVEPIKPTPNPSNRRRSSLSKCQRTVDTLTFLIFEIPYNKLYYVCFNNSFMSASNIAFSREPIYILTILPFLSIMNVVGMECIGP